MIDIKPRSDIDNGCYIFWNGVSICPAPSDMYSIVYCSEDVKLLATIHNTFTFYILPCDPHLITMVTHKFPTKWFPWQIKNDVTCGLYHCSSEY